MFRSRQIALKFAAKEQSEGAGARVHRSIGTHKLRNLDPFLMLDEAQVGLPAAFPDHPHRGFETVSYILPWSKGFMLHEDFAGNKGELRPGDLQWMTAGRGILHSEVPGSTEKSHGLQLWINLPKARKMIPPRYQEVKQDTVPHVFDADNTIEAIVFAGEAFGKKGPIETEAPVTYIHFIMKKGAKLEYRIQEGHNAFLYTLKGEGECVGQKITPHEAVVLEVDGDGVEITTSNDDGVEFIMLSGQPLNEPIVQYGPFVMNTQEEIRQTFFDFQMGKNGFENAPTWVSENSKVLS
ncbi:hypothetical protein Poli38472_008218 [Pythium oligandrum]|uniref:Pirin n=1 Tax=Pythium oligandrum TaxID=41045 RepID=A0A8K1CMX1_PYTOL|nr:hypothetical protein Poli38472_008218 [Pythium oligandrum]|eukprot:TMW65576.1 hypothetical protein Poli38472_008218 [Pythium oligandrum]